MRTDDVATSDGGRGANPSGAKSEGMAASQADMASADNALASEDEASTNSSMSEDDRAVCSICMDMPVAVLVAGCQHGLCVQCAFQLTVKGRELPSCPFCRQKIGGFEAKSPDQAGAGSGATDAQAGNASARMGSEKVAGGVGGLTALPSTTS